MYCILAIVFLLVSMTSSGNHQIGMAIVAGLFGIADAIVYTVNKNVKK